MDFHIFINWMSPFRSLGLLGEIFYFNLSKFYRNNLYANGEDLAQRQLIQATDLCVHCSSIRKDAKLIWVECIKMCCICMNCLNYKKN